MDTSLGKLDAKIDELAELVIAGFGTMNQRFDRLESRMDVLEVSMQKVEGRLSVVEARISNVEVKLSNVADKVESIEQRQIEHNDWLQRLDGRLAGVENDVKELYDMTAETRKQFALQLKKQPEQEKRLRKVEVFARAAARKTGVAFP